MHRANVGVQTDPITGEDTDTTDDTRRDPIRRKIEDGMDIEDVMKVLDVKWLETTFRRTKMEVRSPRNLEKGCVVAILADPEDKADSGILSRLKNSWHGNRFTERIPAR